MFTGLVVGQGVIRDLTQEGSGLRLSITPPWHRDLKDKYDIPPEMAPVQTGESIAINGCCLTVVDHSPEVLEFEAGPETLAKTTLSSFHTGMLVNIERALRLGDSMGGHHVQGHIDTVGTVCEISQDGEWTNLSIDYPKEFHKLLVPKGSITVDGVSLTLVQVEPTRFSLALIPHTLKITNLGDKNIGDCVNLEFDIMAKHIVQLAEPLIASLIERHNT